MENNVAVVRFSVRGKVNAKCVFAESRRHFCAEKRNKEEKEREQRENVQRLFVSHSLIIINRSLFLRIE